MSTKLFTHSRQILSNIYENKAIYSIYIKIHRFCINNSVYYNLMDKLKELLQKSKPTSKIVEQKKVIEEQNKKFKETQLE